MLIGARGSVGQDQEPHHTPYEEKFEGKLRWSTLLQNLPLNGNTIGTGPEATSKEIINAFFLNLLFSF